MGEKLDDLRAADGAGKQPTVKVPPSHAGHGRQHLPIEVILQHRRLSPWRPGPATVWALAQSAFIDEDDGAALFSGFFLTPANAAASRAGSCPRRVPAPVPPAAGKSNPVAAESAKLAKGGTS